MTRPSPMMAFTGVAASASSPASGKSAPAYSWYVVAVLMLAYLISFLDRQIISLLVGPLKADLGLSDTQIGLLQGLSFALFYTFLGIPIGRLADSSNRRNLIIGGIALWSLMTALCGLARNFVQLFLARMGVGVGEATLSPAAYAMIADYFPPRQLSFAMSLYSLGAFMGVGAALIAGGALVGFAESLGSINIGSASFAGWQIIFIVLGLFGIVGILAMLTVKEPVRMGSGTGEPVSFRATFSYVGRNRRTFISLFCGFSCFILMSSALNAWVPTVLIRVYGWAPAEAGYAIGIAALTASAVGILFGGWVSDRAIEHGVPDAPLTLGAVSAAGLTAAMGGLYLASSSGAVVTSIAFGYFFLALPLGVAPAAVQMVAPGTMRSQLAAFYLSTINLIGLGFGPTIVAFWTDFIFREEMRVQQSLAATGLMCMPIGLFLLWWGRPAFRLTLDRLGALRRDEGIVDATQRIEEGDKAS